MIVGKGSLTFRSYNILGANPVQDPEHLIEKLDQFAFDGFVGEEGKARGWMSVEHLLDVDFTWEKNCRGPFVIFGLRLDQRKVPPAIYKAHCLLELKATREALGTDKVPLDERRDIRRRVRQQLLADSTPTSRAFSVIWNVKRRRLYFGSTSPAVIADFTELFQRSFELNLEPRNPTNFAMDYARDHEMLDAFNDMIPEVFYAEPVSRH